MCKLFMVLGITNPEQAMKMARLIQPDLTKDDGHGYGLVQWDGNPLHGPKIQKWLNPKEAFMEWRADTLPNGLIPYLHQTGETGYFTAGPEQGPLKVILSHARFATCEKTLRNVHPFQRRIGGWESTLVHNGIVSSLHAKYAMDTRGSDGCDSMGLLAEYMHQKTPDLLDSVTQLGDILGGFAAFGVITRRTKRSKSHGPEGFVDIGRADASLMLVMTTAGMIFTTKEEFGINAARRAGVEITGIWGVDNDQVLRFTPEGKLLGKAKLSLPARKSVYDLSGKYDGWKDSPATGSVYHQSTKTLSPKTPVDELKEETAAIKTKLGLVNQNAIPEKAGPDADGNTVRIAPPGTFRKVDGRWDYEVNNADGGSFKLEGLSDADKAALEDMDLTVEDGVILGWKGVDTQPEVMGIVDNLEELEASEVD